MVTSLTKKFKDPKFVSEADAGYSVAELVDYPIMKAFFDQNIIYRVKYFDYYILDSYG